MFRLLIRTIVCLVRAALRSRDDLVLENLALRQQLAIYKEKRPHPPLTDSVLAFWVGIRAAWPRWQNALIPVQPDTVVRWHRHCFAWLWCRKCRSRPRGRPPVTPELRDLIRRMATENRTPELRDLIRRMATENRWGAPRIHAELLKLGFTVSERTVSRYLPRRPTSPDAVKRWLAFLRNHRDVIAGVDFFTVPTATFQLLHVFTVSLNDGFCPLAASSSTTSW